MNKTLIMACVTGLVFLAGSSTVAAQDDGMLVIPTELYACAYKEGKGPSDLDPWIDKWNAWADKKKIVDYAAWTLTPFYYGAGVSEGIDVIWLGAAKNAIALGKAQDMWVTDNGGLSDELDEMMTCAGHASFASLNYKPAPGGKTPKNSVLTFSDCSYVEGATFSAMNAAMSEWSQHLSDAGSSATIFHWYPVYGGGGEDFDFKWIEAHENLADLGADFEIFGNGAGFVTYGRLLNHIVECDASRAYLAENHRYVKLR